MTSSRFVDRTAGWVAIAFLVTLLASEAVITLPDADAQDAAVASFYAGHRALVVLLQVVGFAACVLLAVFAYRVRGLGRGVAGAGLVLAFAAAAPGAITLAAAVVADPRSPAAAGSVNRWEPRGDDLLFLAVTGFALAVAGAAAAERVPRWIAGLAVVVAMSCAARLLSELVGGPSGTLGAFAPVSFLLLVAALARLCFAGYPPPRTVRRRTVRGGPQR